MEFPNTTWGVVRKLKPGEEGYRAGIETLCRRYWAPIRAYARSAWASDDHDADDLAQEFFVWLLDGSVLERYASEKGSFRNYLKGLLRNFGRNYRKASRRLKRGGGKAPARLEAGASVPDPRSLEAEERFDRAFATEVMTHAVERLRARMAGGPRELHWRVFEAYDLKPEEERPTYAALARLHGVSEGDVRTYLHRVRNLLRTEIRAELSETVSTAAELDEEWRRVLG